MATFVKSVIINAPVESVFGFHEREDALPLLSPPFPPLRIVATRGGLAPGSVVELRVMGMLWTAVHTACERNHLFIDEQQRGPFAKWIHRHEFEDLGSRTRLTDRVEYELPGGALPTALLNWAIKPALQRMFAHRHRVTKAICEKAPLS